ncbi:hypothetical protein HHK36_011920 [Tetracentron sinense]|uniref:Uncharacterized protein n=1 Tax=Tetracentron sinense TaxID=13715 RepID=A0A834ZAA4_TETSI|nr:hypothetical protein HHK36_011920 [Tetracentron sinense]
MNIVIQLEATGYDAQSQSSTDTQCGIELLSFGDLHLVWMRSGLVEGLKVGEESPRHDGFPMKTVAIKLCNGVLFIRSEEDDMDPSWEQRLVKRYYDKLFKEYCIADMSQYKSGKIGLRWRIEKEVISGKGQFICGNRQCNERDGLASYEVNFSYFEAGKNKQALVKLVACGRTLYILACKDTKEAEDKKYHYQYQEQTFDFGSEEDSEGLLVKIVERGRGSSVELQLRERSNNEEQPGESVRGNRR